MSRRFIKRKSNSSINSETAFSEQKEESSPLVIGNNEQETQKHAVLNDHNGDVIFDLVMDENENSESNEQLKQNIVSDLDDCDGSTMEHENGQNLLLPIAQPEKHKTPKKKRRFHKNVPSSAESSPSPSKTLSENETEKFTFNSVAEESSQIQPAQSISYEFHNVQQCVNNETRDQEQVLPIAATENNATSKRTTKSSTDDTTKENIVIKTTKKDSKSSKKTKKRHSTIAAEMLTIDKDNKVCIGGDLYLVRKVSNMYVVDLSKYLPSLYSKKDLPGPLQDLLDDNKYLLNDEKVKLNKQMYITCTMNALQETTNKKVLLFLKGAENIGGTTIQCHICRAPDGAKLICDNSTLFNILHFEQKYDVGKDNVNKKFSFPSLPCTASICKDCIEIHDHGDFEYYAQIGHFVCPHCRSCCPNDRCYSRKNYPNGGLVKYNGRNAEEVFVRLATNTKYELKKQKTEEVSIVEKKESPKEKCEEIEAIAVSSETNQSTMVDEKVNCVGESLASLPSRNLRSKSIITVTKESSSKSNASSQSTSCGDTEISEINNVGCVSFSATGTRHGFPNTEEPLQVATSLFETQQDTPLATSKRKRPSSKGTIQLKTGLVASYLIRSFSRHFSNHRQTQRELKSKTFTTQEKKV
ncbi:hypothetical protein FDP41_010476 [Naegleria fowleri]|uniref:Uncharacterized protein n=1 Tax=Naegleria fowleri TaxID=5763 RepID=A0A6A5C8E3_NAEFO|nr:uncharacterized protein FDP41_010476 [Naegleria fowleri]KAF0983411.1 hypothetical protein FDP41_010476 [Naegleria fowleri]CAG4715910.1 unnamed protein product [Naegleria fowleri]